MIIIVFGLPGAGKSYFGQKLAEAIKSNYISSEKVRRQRVFNPTYSDHERHWVYDTLAKEMHSAIDKHQNIVIDATFSTNESRARFIQEAGDQERVIMIEVYAPESVIKERLSHPRSDSEADYQVYLKLKSRWQPCSYPHLQLDSNQLVTAMIAAATQYMFSTVSEPVQTMGKV